MAAEKSPPAPMTVSQLTGLIKAKLEGDFRLVDVEGEISGWKLYPSGHAYFTLKDEGAQIPGVMFSSSLSAALEADPSLGKSLRDGAKVKARGSVSVYPPRGAYQFVVRRIRLSGEGELMRKYLELKAKLAAEGLFDSSRKRPLPFLPRRIGIVTSESGAVIHDMERVFTRRFPGIHIRLFPALVQGEDAPRTIIAGIDYFNSNPWADIVIVARGGGSFEDLFCFNDEALVRAVAASAVPVISAVGHESDFTLCDFAADVRAGTPSIAAEIAVPLKSELAAKLDDLKLRLAVSLRSKGETFAQRFDHVSDGLVRALRLSLERAGTKLENASKALVLSLRSKGETFAQRLDHASDGLVRALRLSHERAGAKLENARRALALLSPYAVLDRGYSLVTDEAGAVVKSAASLSPGAVVRARFAEGCATARIEEVEGK